MQGTSAEVVFEHSFEQSTLDDLIELRQFRLATAEKMLSNIAITVKTLESRGVKSEDNKAYSIGAVRAELEERIHLLQERLRNPQQIYADELELYVELMHDAAAKKAKK